MIFLEIVHRPFIIIIIIIIIIIKSCLTSIPKPLVYDGQRVMWDRLLCRGLSLQASASAPVGAWHSWYLALSSPQAAYMRRAI